jgi:tRNA/rRNA methyltransferase
MSVSIILVAPQMGENIGAVARAMKNFDIYDLRIINPRDGWPNEKAVSMSVGAFDLIANAKIFSSVVDAISDLSYVYATTATSRDMNKECIFSRDLKNNLPKAGKIGIMFGRENCGLNNQEISYANKIITIDTNLSFSSLNIAHSVAVICYELFQDGAHLRSHVREELAKKEELEYFYTHLFDVLEDRKFFRMPEKREQMSVKIKNIFARITNLSRSELQTLRGIITVLSGKN